MKTYTNNPSVCFSVLSTDQKVCAINKISHIMNISYMVINTMIKYNHVIIDDLFRFHLTPSGLVAVSKKEFNLKFW